MQDPLADGPTIQAAATRALAAGCTLNKVNHLPSRDMQSMPYQPYIPLQMGTLLYMTQLP